MLKKDCLLLLSLKLSLLHHSDYEFSALPSGRRTADGVYDLLGEYGDLWSSSMVDETNAYVLVLTAVFRTDVLSADMRSAFAVRCIKD